MKKKLILATAIVLLLAISVSMLVGCDEIIKKNETRDAKQVVATVTYKDKTEYVYKYELETVFNNYAPAYVNYYGMTYEEAANTLVKSLAQQKLLNLFALYKVAELKHVNVPTKAEELLTKSERNKAVIDSNESMLSTLVSIVEDLIIEDNANAGGTNTDSKTDEKVEVTKDNEVFVRFETNGATAIDKQRIAKGTKATEPTDPTRTGYTFYGWHLDKNCNEDGYVGDEFDFDTAVTGNITLYAKWVKHTDARTERPTVEEEEDYDPEDDTVKIAAKFFTEDYQKGLFDADDAESVFNKKFVEADFAKNVVYDKETTTLQEALKEYVAEGLADMKKQLMANLYKDNVEECYEYYLNSQMQSVLITRLKRMIKDNVEVSEKEIKKQYEDAVAKNNETYKGNESGYKSALTSSLSGTYYHPTKDYGFVINILLKLDDESMTKLKNFAKETGAMGQTVLTRRNQLIADMKVKVSNPNYKSGSKIEDKDGNEIEVRDAYTDSRNPYNKVGKTADNPYDNSYEYKTEEGTYANDYNQIVDFEEVDGEYQIVFKATQHPSMAYLLEDVPAFDYVEGGVTKNGIIHQIYNTFDKVNAATGLTHEQRVYWLREVATTWLYLVGDDSGAVSSESNNNGLGYIVAPDDSNTFIADFTDYAQSLIKKGTGAYRTEEVTDFTSSFAGNKKAYVVADNLVTEKDGKYVVGDTSNAYAGVFVLLNSYTVWDKTNIKGGDKDFESENEANMTLPYDYVITFAKSADDVKTIEETIRETLKDAKATDQYNSLVNTEINNLKDTIKYNDKVIKDLWKDLD